MHDILHNLSQQELELLLHIYDMPCINMYGK